MFTETPEHNNTLAEYAGLSQLYTIHVDKLRNYKAKRRDAM
jgi:hypothetical protein